MSSNVRWEPIPQSLEYDLITHAIKHGEIPSEYRLCRQVAATQAEPPAMPQGGAQWTLVENGWLTLTKKKEAGAVREVNTNIRLPNKNYRVYRRTPASPAPEGVTHLTVNEYQLYDSPRIGGITLRRMPQRSGPDKWAIYDGGSVVLSREYEDGDPWEYEPIPSSRDDAYLARCRYDSAEEALQHWHTWLAAQRPPASQPQG